LSSSSENARTDPKEPDVEIAYEARTDEAVLGTALRGHASHIVTGDKHLLKIRTFREVRLVTVAEMFDVLKTTAT